MYFSESWSILSFDKCIDKFTVFPLVILLITTQISKDNLPLNPGFVYFPFLLINLAKILSIVLFFGKASSSVYRRSLLFFYFLCQGDSTSSHVNNLPYCPFLKCIGTECFLVYILPVVVFTSHHTVKWHRDHMIYKIQNYLPLGLYRNVGWPLFYISNIHSGLSVSCVLHALGLICSYYFSSLGWNIEHWFESFFSPNPVISCDKLLSKHWFSYVTHILIYCAFVVT